MPSTDVEDDAELLRSVRRWLLVVALLLGLVLVALADIGSAVVGYWDHFGFTLARLVGGLVALVAGAQILRPLVVVDEAPE